MCAMQGFTTVKVSFARELADQKQCLLLGVLIKTARRIEFANRGFFNVDPEIALPSAEGDLVLDEFEFSEERVRLLVVPLDLNDTSILEDIGKVHGVLIKTSDFQTEDEKQKLKSVLEVLENFPDVCQIDKQKHIKRVMERSQFPKLLPVDFKKSEKLCSFPNSFTLHHPLTESQFLDVLHHHGIKFPLILKTSVACGDSRSHFMALVNDVSGVSEIRVDFPLQVQQFHPHGHSLFKVYIIGTKIFIQEESSLDILSRTQDCNIVHFDALEEKKTPLKESQLNRLDNEVLRQTAIKLKSTSGLNLFGFDVIVDDRNRHFVIDVNYFPSMKRIKNSIGAIHQLCHSLILSHQNAQNSNSM